MECLPPMNSTITHTFIRAMYSLISSPQMKPIYDRNMIRNPANINSRGTMALLLYWLSVQAVKYKRI